MRLTKAELDLDDAGPKAHSDKDLPANYPETDDLEPDKYTTYARALWDEQEGSLEQLHRTWTQNLLFLAGLQWWKLDAHSGIFRPEAAPKWRERPVSNILVPFFKHFLAKVTKNDPAFQSMAASTDPEDIESATLADDALKAKWRELRIARAIRRALAWVIPTGNAYTYPYWNTFTGNLEPLTVPVQAMKVDAETGEPVVDPETLEPIIEEFDCPCDENGEPLLTEDGGYDVEAEPKWVDVGDVGVRILSPFQVRVNPGAECDEDVTVVLVGEVLPNREIRRRWPHLTVSGTEDLGLMERYDSLVSGLATTGSGADTHVVGGAADRGDEVEKSLVIHYHEKQSPEFPQGRYWVGVGNELAEDPQPLPDNLWPVIHHLKELEVAGRYHGASTFEAAVGLQREYNEVNAMIKEHHNLMLRGKWLVPIGSNIRRGQITQQPGEVIQHTPGLEPKMAQLQPLPNQVYQERERILNDFERITSVHRISMGEAPPGVTSGRAFLTLQEADDTDYGPFLDMLEETIAELAWSFLQLMQRRYDEERLIYIMGQDRKFMVKSFKGSDLTGVVDVVPVAGSSAPWSSVARQNMLLEIVNTEVGQSLFMDQKTGMFDKRRFAQMLPVAGLDSLYEYEHEDYNEAQREEEIFEFYTGEDPSQLPRVLPWQNHQAHLETIERRLKSAGFGTWHPAAQEAYIAHWQETQMAIQQEMMQQMMMQAQADAAAAVPPGGGGGGGGGGSPPADGAGAGSAQEQPALTDNERAMKGE